MSTVAEKELNKLLEKEAKYLAAKTKASEAVPLKGLERYVPEKLQETLEQAFEKGFSLCFQRGNAVIEKTFSKEKKAQDFQINAYADQIKGNKKTLRAFSKQSKATVGTNLLMTTFEGMGLGLLGIGMPDIPLFLGMLLKSVYEISISYGFDYGKYKEQVFILKLISTALTQGDIFVQRNREVEIFLQEETIQQDSTCLNQEIHQAAKALSDQLLYAKFIQTIPIAGIVGGAFNNICMSKVTHYADLKYRKRFLQQTIQRQKEESKV